jgi:glycosyltransferase involved in cell wall biosynthesis
MDIFLILTIPAMMILALVAWNALAWPKVLGVGTAADIRPNSVSVLIPARNEERHLPACLDAVLRQGAVVVEVLVYEDHSTDATAYVIRDYAGRDGRVRPVQSAALAEGWCGKDFACAQLARAAQSDWMLFLDADARLADGAVVRMIAEARRRRLTLLSCWPGLTLCGFWEKALMPMLNFTVFTLFPAPLSLARDDASLGLAHGACLLVDRASYEAIGGHAAVRDQIFEDTRLAQLWRVSGRRGLCLDGQELVSVRMYGSFAEIWRGFQKNFFPAFRRQTSFWAFLALHATVFFAPFFLFGLSANVALAAVCVLLIRAMLAARFRHPWWSNLLHPVSEAVLIALGLSSWRRCKSGKGVAWKGRVYLSDVAGGADGANGASKASRA